MADNFDDGVYNHTVGCALLCKNGKVYKGINCDGKRARQMTHSDYDYYDLLIGMDNWNIRNMLRITGGDPDNKIKMLLDFTNRPGEVADPWYTRDFVATWRDVNDGCKGLLEQLMHSR